MQMKYKLKYKVILGRKAEDDIERILEFDADDAKEARHHVAIMCKPGSELWRTDIGINNKKAKLVPVQLISVREQSIKISLG